MTTRGSAIVGLAVASVLLALTGCAEQAATTEPQSPVTAAAPPQSDQPATTAPAPPPGAQAVSPPSSRPSGEAPATASGTAPGMAGPQPSTPESATAPAAVQPSKQTEDFVDEPHLKDVLFGPGRTQIGGPGVRIMHDNARWLLENPRNLVLIEGHTDYKGTREQNFAVGERRAGAAKDLLVKDGVAEARISTVSYGEDRPVCREKTEACAARNRRVHFRVKAQ